MFAVQFVDRSLTVVGVENVFYAVVDLSVVSSITVTLAILLVVYVVYCWCLLAIDFHHPIVGTSTIYLIVPSLYFGIAPMFLIFLVALVGSSCSTCSSRTGVSLSIVALKDSIGRELLLGF